MNIRNNPIHNFIKDVIYGNEFQKNYSSFASIKDGIAYINYAGQQMKFYCSSAMSGKAYVSIYQSFDFPFFAREFNGYLQKYKIKEGDIVVDCGSYFGNFTVYASKAVGPKGKVYSFEPDLENFIMLQKNIELNGCKNVVLVNAGVYSKDTIIKFNSGGLGSMIDSNGTSKIKVVSLDNYILRNKIKKVDFIKMDIEGAEIEALIGMNKLLKQGSPNLAIASYHIINGEKSYKLVDQYLQKLKYKTQTGFPSHCTTCAWKG